MVDKDRFELLQIVIWLVAKEPHPYEIITLSLAEAVEKMLISKGMHPKGFTLMGFGAAGPMFSVSAARELSIPEVVIPYFPGGFAALGMLTSRLKVEHAISPMEHLDGIGYEKLNNLFHEIEEECITDLEKQGVAREKITLERTLCGMYSGQSWDQRVPVPAIKYDENNFLNIRTHFDEYYDSVFGYKAVELPIFLTTVSSIAYGPYPKIKMPKIEKGNSSPDKESILMKRSLYLDRNEYTEVPFYNRFKLKAGNEIKGPAIIDDKLSTIVVNEHATATVEGYGNIIIKI